MEIAKLVLEYWKASIWPIFLMVAVLVFRKQISDALRRAKTIDAMGVNVELAEQVEEVQAAAENVIEGIREDLEESHNEEEVRPPGRVAIEKAQAALEALPAEPPDILLDRNLALEKLAFYANRAVMRFESSLDTVAHAFGHEEFNALALGDVCAETGVAVWAQIYQGVDVLRNHRQSQKERIALADDKMQRARMRREGYELTYDLATSLTKTVYLALRETVDSGRSSSDTRQNTSDQT